MATSASDRPRSRLLLSRSSAPEVEVEVAFLDQEQFTFKLTISRKFTYKGRKERRDRKLADRALIPQ